MMYSVCGEITDIYEHWVSEHSLPPKPQPFRFEVLTLLSCYYCDYIAPYHRMVEHHQASHYNESFIAITASQPNKCAMCQSTELVGHFELDHEIFLQTKNANPVFMKDELVMKLNKIDIHKKPQCGYCEAIFESEHELNAHHSVAHPSRDILIKHLCDNRVSHLICGFCSDFRFCWNILRAIRTALVAHNAIFRATIWLLLLCMRRPDIKLHRLNFVVWNSQICYRNPILIRKLCLAMVWL